MTTLLRGRRPILAVSIEPLVWLIWLYQKTISPLLGPRCRFHPSCSTYAGQALRTHGLLRGLMLATKRVCRCHPFSPGGIDPVPEITTSTRNKSET
ncbi:MAG: membrane protein insertion efficiency factor YidD [Deltaproteobacteria bacterium]|nr:membrane protein insertion efficiency factor YidD [Deltaproteobacteria bacterium]